MSIGNPPTWYSNFNHWTWTDHTVYRDPGDQNAVPLILPGGDTVAPLGPAEATMVTQAQMERLMFLLGLIPEERAFVRAAINGEKVSLLVFADWLDDKSRAEEAARLRELADNQ